MICKLLSKVKKRVDFLLKVYLSAMYLFPNLLSGFSLLQNSYSQKLNKQPLSACNIQSLKHSPLSTE